VTTRTPPQHGERACYLRGCQLPECAAANYRWTSRYRLDVHEGRPRRTDSTPTRVHIERLHAAGWTQAQIARAANIAHRVITAVLNGQEMVSNRTALAVLSIPVGTPPADQRDVDATATVRRVRALVTIGYPIAQLAPRIGLFPTAAGRIARGELQQVRATTAERVAREYRTLARIPGPSNRARNDARRHGWHGPLAWDDITIDDPQAQPEIDDTVTDLSRNELAAVRRAEVEHLDQFGVSEDDIARRLGLTPSTVHGIIRELRAGERRDRTTAVAA
jgi:transcriptional regulator with XRE-family HTH domain